MMLMLMMMGQAPAATAPAAAQQKMRGSRRARMRPCCWSPCQLATAAIGQRVAAKRSPRLSASQQQPSPVLWAHMPSCVPSPGSCASALSHCRCSGMASAAGTSPIST
eukprot:scaffold35247_cov17-Tisochrysis_lutea.AAC.2